MLDARINRLLRPAMDRAGSSLARRGVGADAVTLAGAGLGLLASGLVVAGWFAAALGCLLLNRLCDGLDGAVARAGTATDRGGLLDIVLDFVLYATFPLAFAAFDPARNALPAAALLAAFLLNATAFLGFAALAARRRLETQAQGMKSFYFLAGLAEGFETVVVFSAACVFPDAFPWLATGFAVLCAASALVRLVVGIRLLA